MRLKMTHRRKYSADEGETVNDFAAFAFKVKATKPLVEKGRRLPMLPDNTSDGGFWEEFLGRPVTNEELQELYTANQDAK